MNKMLIACNMVYMRRLVSIVVKVWEIEGNMKREWSIAYSDRGNT